MSRRPAQQTDILCRAPFASYIATIGACSADFRTALTDTETLGFGNLQRSIERSAIASLFCESCRDRRRSSKSEVIGCALRLSQEFGRRDGGLAR